MEEMQSMETGPGRGPMVEVRHLKKRYGDLEAVKDLSFQLEGGKVYGFLGANGAGKSTTLNMLSGYLGPTSGEILMGELSLCEDPLLWKRRTGYLPEIPPLYPDMTIWEYLLTVAECKRIPARQRRAQVEQAMEELMLTSRRDTCIRGLSKGYCQRVGFAQALLGSPDLLLLDEPTVGLDPEQLLSVRRLIRSLSGRTTILLSSHILGEIAAVCDEILVMRRGELIASGTTQELLLRAQGKPTMRLLVEASREEAVKVAESVPGVAKVQVREALEDPLNGPGQRVWELELLVEGGADPRRDLFLAFSQKHCPILEMGRVTLSLEEAFVELVQGEGSSLNGSFRKGSFGEEESVLRGGEEEKE